ncbi:metallophosphoesterase [Bdellovibrio sp. HCB288]|uniref:metallophosphoesterase n=1 Tax=Bdellovibrio sp. HCB288 TaxID=3394355 RepID=UPI0039B3BEAD
MNFGKVGSVLGILVIAACAHKPMDRVEGLTYVGLADGNTSFVRTIAPKNGKCPEVKISKGSAEETTLQMTANKFESATVCEATLPEGTASVSVAGKQIQIPKAPKRIVVFGDTGCRLKGDYFQECNDPNQWPFKRIAKAIELEKADLIVHVGDYHYRESCKDPVKCAPYKDTLGYGYRPWEADFLHPAAPLLQTTPFLFVRGNHEDCQRAHEGFSRLLTPLGESSCPKFQDTRYTNFGNILVVNFDNATLSDQGLDPKGTEMNQWREHYRKMVAQIKSRPESEVWIVLHRPIWGLSPNWNGPAAVLPVNLNMQLLVKEMPLPKKVKFVFAGHIHNTQVSTGKRPVHVVVGEGGTALDYYDEATRKLIPAGFTVLPSTHGYMVLEQNSDGKWVGVVKDDQGKASFKCSLEQANAPCAVP